MEAHTLNQSAMRSTPARRRLDAAAIARTGAIAGLAAGMMMAMWQMAVGAIAQDPTAVPGIHTSLWTPVTAITSVIFGADAFHGSFHFWPVLAGLMGHMMNAMVLGVLGIALLVAVQGPRPKLPAAVMQGVMFGLVLQVVIVNLVVNQIQSIDTLYTSTPEWSWWVSHGIFGMTLGAFGALLLRRVR